MKENDNLNENSFSYSNSNLFKKPKNNKKIKIFSNAFPPNINTENKKIQMVKSDVHRFLRDENIEIKIEDIKYRKIIKEDLIQLKPLFLEWFPIEYHEVFFDNIFMYMENNCGISYVAYIENPKFDSKNYKENTQNFKHFTQIIIGVILTNKEKLESYEKNAFYNYENLGILEEINFNTKYFVYIQSLGILDECRRLKLGSILLDKIINDHRNDIDCLGIFLHVVIYNSIAINFYSKFNFKETNYLYNYYKIDDNSYDSLVMTRLFYKNDRLKTDYLRLFLDLFNLPIRILILIFTFGFCCNRCRNKRRYKKRKKIN
jgi:ribosomal protein S18 acetylase RimI-like enzyme